MGGVWIFREWNHALVAGAWQNLFLAFMTRIAAWLWDHLRWVRLGRRQLRLDAFNRLLSPWVAEKHDLMIGLCGAVFCSDK